MRSRTLTYMCSSGIVTVQSQAGSSRFRTPGQQSWKGTMNRRNSYSLRADSDASLEVFAAKGQRACTNNLTPEQEILSQKISDEDEEEESSRVYKLPVSSPLRLDGIRLCFACQSDQGHGPFCLLSRGIALCPAVAVHAICDDWTVNSTADSVHLCDDAGGFRLG